MSNLPLNDQVSGQPANDAGYAALMAVKPGERLRKARKERKLDLESAAQQLNLSESVLRALEKDDYAALPSSTFIKGYIRSYARMLRLPGDELVRAFEYQTGLHSSMDEQHPVPDAPAKRSTKLIPLFVAVLMVALAVAWLMMSGDGEGEAVPSESASTSSETEVQKVAPAKADPVTTEQLSPKEVVSEPVAVKPEPVVEPVKPIAKPDVELVVAPEPEPLAVKIEASTSDVASAPSEVKVSEAVDSPLQEPVPEVVAEQPEEKSQLVFQFDNPTAEAPATKGELVMTFSDDCWVEIRDQNQRLIHADLHRAGSRYVRQYAEPFDVKLGNGNAVQVFYNGSPVVYARSKRSNVARFTIGSSVSDQ